MSNGRESESRAGSPDLASGRLDESAVRCTFFERQMRPATFVVLEIIFQDAMQQPGLMEDHDMVQAFAADRTVLWRSPLCGADA